MFLYTFLWLLQKHVFDGVKTKRKCCLFIWMIFGWRILSCWLVVLHYAGCIISNFSQISYNIHSFCAHQGKFPIF